MEAFCIDDGCGGRVKGRDEKKKERLKILSSTLVYRVRVFHSTRCEVFSFALVVRSYMDTYTVLNVY